MNQVAQFEKVSFEQYASDCRAAGRTASDKELYKEWESIKLPTRATAGSAGYDFYMPYSEQCNKEWVTIPTGIRCMIEPGWFLMACPKSGLGFKHMFRLANTIGIIDSDYYNSENEGHINAKFASETAVQLNAGQKYMQCILLPYGITYDDDADGVRNGGFGSTGE